MFQFSVFQIQYSNDLNNHSQLLDILHICHIVKSIRINNRKKKLLSINYSN
jgi:hypothetical protein